MAQKKKYLKKILNYEIEADLIISLFDKWLSEEDCDSEVLSDQDVNSLETYDKLKMIELNYLQFMTSVNSKLVAHIVDTKVLEINKNRASFYQLFKEVANHINNSEQKVIYISNIESFIVLSHDFTIYVYQNNKGLPLDEFKKISIENNFYILARLC